MVTKVLLSNEFGNNIFTRNTISLFFEKISHLKEEEIALDFSGVNFISRSCADEYLKRKQNSSKKIIEANMSKEVYSMFCAVQNQYKKAGFPISFSVCQSEKKRLITA